MPIGVAKRPVAKDGEAVEDLILAANRTAAVTKPQRVSYQAPTLCSECHKVLN